MEVVACKITIIIIIISIRQGANRSDSDNRAKRLWMRRLKILLRHQCPPSISSNSFFFLASNSTQRVRSFFFWDDTHRMMMEDYRNFSIGNHQRAAYEKHGMG